MSMMDLLTGGMPDIGGMVRMIGQGLNAQYQQLCAIAGYLKPSTVPQIKAGTTTSGVAGTYSGSDVLVCSFQTKRIDITLFDNGVFVRTGANVDGAWDTGFELIGPGFYSFPVAARRFAVARSGAAESRYSLVAWT